MLAKVKHNAIDMEINMKTILAAAVLLVSAHMASAAVPQDAIPSDLLVNNPTPAATVVTENGTFETAWICEWEYVWGPFGLEYVEYCY